SYRLVLPAEKKEAKPYLQGWAVVENQTDEDWRGVRMALVSGRPVSFRMDLYTPLYVPRPLVEPELFASLRPVAYSGSLDAPERAATWGGAGGVPPPPMAPGAAPMAGFGVRGPATYYEKTKDSFKRDGKGGEYGAATRRALAEG